LHQAAYHGRYEMAKLCIELGAPLNLEANPCGRPGNGTPFDLARGGGHTHIADMINAALGVVEFTKIQVALYSPAAGYLTNNGTFGKSDVP